MHPASDRFPFPVPPPKEPAFQTGTFLSFPLPAETPRRRVGLEAPLRTLLQKIETFHLEAAWFFAFGTIAGITLASVFLAFLRR